MDEEMIREGQEDDVRRLWWLVIKLARKEWAVGKRSKGSFFVAICSLARPLKSSSVFSTKCFNLDLV